MLESITGRFGSNSSENSVVGGSGAVFQAILENSNGARRYVVTLGEPELVNRGGEYSTEYMVRIPTRTMPGDPEPPNIEYNLPDGGMEDENSELFELLDTFNIEQVSDLGDLEGEAVMATFENGFLTLHLEDGYLPSEGE